VVIVSPAHRVRAIEARKLVARARERGSVLVQVESPSQSPQSAPRNRQSRTLPLFEAELRLTVLGARWHGVGKGHGHLSARHVMVELSGRRGASRSRRADLFMPYEGHEDTEGSEGSEPFAGSDIDW